MKTETGAPIARLPAESRARSITSVSLFSALALVFGYARDIAIIIIFGSSGQTDAFFAAIIIPIMLGRVIMSGALAPAIMPVFAELQRDKARRGLVASNLITLAVPILALLSLGVGLGAGNILELIAPGFNSENNQQAVLILQITAPAIGLLGLAALIGALLNVSGVFGFPALGNALLNFISFIAIPVFAVTLGITGAAVGMLAGALCQTALQLVALRRQGWRYRPASPLTLPEIREVSRLFLPLVAFMLVDQTVTVTERVIGSSLPPGQLSQLALANKLYQIPSFVLSGAIVTVMFGGLVGASASSRPELFKGTWRSAIVTLLLITLPSAIWLYFGSQVVVNLVLRHGQFTATDAQTTASLLSLYSLAVVPTGLLLLNYRAMQALKGMGLSLMVSLVVAAFYVLLALTLANSWGIFGLPIAFAISQMAGVGLTLVVLNIRFRQHYRIGHSEPVKNLKTDIETLHAVQSDRSAERLQESQSFTQTLKKIILANLLLVSGLTVLWLTIWPYLDWLPGLVQAIIVGLAGLASSGLYLWVCGKAGIDEAQAYLSTFRRLLEGNKAGRKMCDNNWEG